MENSSTWDLVNLQTMVLNHQTYIYTIGKYVDLMIRGGYTILYGIPEHGGFANRFLNQFSIEPPAVDKKRVQTANQEQLPTEIPGLVNQHWLVVWNIFYFPIYWECHHPN